MTHVQTTTTAAVDRVPDRLPIFSALSVLGFSYAELGRLLGVSTVAVHRWATEKKPLSTVRHLALLFVVTRLTGVIDAGHPPQTRYARRAEIAITAAKAWNQLARDELDERTGSTYHAEEIERGVALGERIIARLEMQ